MPLSPDLWDSLIPPAIWAALEPLSHPHADHRRVNVRVKEEGKRSVSASVDVSRYAPEASIFLALSKMMDRLQVLQVALSRDVLVEELHHVVATWVEPF
jgi:hypothetical protein